MNDTAELQVSSVGKAMKTIRSHVKVICQLWPHGVGKQKNIDGCSHVFLKNNS